MQVAVLTTAAQLLLNFSYTCCGLCAFNRMHKSVRKWGTLFTLQTSGCCFCIVEEHATISTWYCDREWENSIPSQKRMTNHWQEFLCASGGRLVPHPYILAEMTNNNLVDVVSCHPTEYISHIQQRSSPGNSDWNEQLWMKQISCF